MTLAKQSDPEGSIENPFRIVGGPDSMELMLAVFAGKPVYFTLNRRRGVVTVHIAGLRKIDSNNGNWTVWGTIAHQDHRPGDMWVKFEATYMMQGGKRTGTLHYSEW